MSVQKENVGIGEIQEFNILGQVQEFNVNGPWGVILVAGDNPIWFNGDSLAENGVHLQVGDKVEFDVFYHAEQRSWEAVNIRRTHVSHSGQEPVAPEIPVEPSTSEVTEESAESEAGEEFYSGIVKHFDRDRGWGFIARDDGKEYFVHRRNVEGEGYRYLVKDEPVEFRLQFDNRQDNEVAVAVRSPSYRKKGVVKSWDNARGFGRIQPDGETSDIFFHYTAILGRTNNRRTSAEEGESVEFEIKRGAKKPKAVRVKRLDSRLPLFRFANMGAEDDWLKGLALKAESENWEYLHTQSAASHPILRSYLAYTFARVKEESDAAEERDKKIRLGSDGTRRFACFNTGLVTPNQEPIYALFVEQNSARDGCEWRLQSFCAKSDRPMLGKFDQLPEMANYFDDPRELIYDRKCELVLDVDHIIDDRLDRFPRVVHEADDPPAMARNLLHSAQERAVQRVNRNYKTAIPHYYQGSIQLLLPLCLVSANTADLALTVTRYGDQYRGGTVLTLDMAYNNARLLTKPDTEWLQP